MKTGRRRKKSAPQEAPKTAVAPQSQATTPPRSPRPSAKGQKTTSSRSPARSRSPVGFVFLAIVIFIAVLACATLVLGRACSGPKAKPEDYYQATASGSWTTMVRLMAPEVTERWRSDCEADAHCAVLAGTCQRRERADPSREHQVDEYDEFAYSIYYEESENKVYETGGDSFVVTGLGGNRDWWEEDLHYYADEWLDKETCQYTDYSVWITDPKDKDYEIEVVLSECEVWEHIVVKERVTEEDEYCQVEDLDSLVVQDTLQRQGSGITPDWAGARAPANGELEHAFQGVVVFRADGAERTVTTTDEDAYERYLTVPHYLGLDDRGRVVDLTDKAP